MAGQGPIAENRRARFEYVLSDLLECGIVLTGAEVKSLRAAQLAFRDSFCCIENGELWLCNLHISPYAFATDGGSHLAAGRRRKLLASSRQISQLHRKVREKGYSIVPTRLYFKGALVKVEIALARGKKLHDKRRSIQERDLQRAEGRSLRIK